MTSKRMRPDHHPDPWWENAPPVVFSLHSGFGQRVADALGTHLALHEERHFEDGEHKIRPLQNVRHRNVYVIESLHRDQDQSVNDKLCKLLFMIGALKDASATSVTAVIPYLCYARKDRKTKPRDPVTTRYIAKLFESVQLDRLVTVDVHNLAAFQNAFHRTRTDHLEAMRLFVDHFADHIESHPDAPNCTIVSPDVGGVKRVEQFREALSRRLGCEFEVAFMQKSRSAGIVRSGPLVGDVRGRMAILLDDLISGGTTLANAAAACQAAGAERIYAAATHGNFSVNAEQMLANSPIDKLVITNTITLNHLSQSFIQDRVHVIDTSDYLAAAIRCLHTGDSIVDLNATDAQHSFRGNSKRPSSPE